MAENDKVQQISLKIGILAIQGAFIEHKTCLLMAKDQMGVGNKNFRLDVVEVKCADHLEGLTGLIIPGGESTVMGKALEKNGFGRAIKTWMTNTSENIVWGTCAGMILLAKDLQKMKAGGQAHLGGLDVQVSRNFFGRQINSFEAKIDIKDDALRGEDEQGDFYHGVFIRAPAVDALESKNVKILATVLHSKSVEPVIVAVKQNNIIATAFHPELTNDPRWHRYFLELVLHGQLKK